MNRSSTLRLALTVVTSIAGLLGFLAPRSQAAYGVWTLHGTVRYEDASDGVVVEKPVRFCEFRVRPYLKGKGWGSWSSPLATDSQGFFSYAVYGDVEKAEAYIRPWNYACKVHLDLTENTGEVVTTYAWPWSAKATPGSGFQIDMGFLITQDMLSAQMNVADTMLTGRMYADERRGDTDGLGKVHVEYPSPEWSNAWTHIEISGPLMTVGGYPCGGNDSDHGFQDGIILHEYGHFVDAEIGGTDPQSKDHSGCDDFGPAFAWQEGFATYFGDAVGETYPALVEVGFDDSLPGCPIPDTESTVKACLWDLFDGIDEDSEAFDHVDGQTVVPSSEYKKVERIVFEILDKELDHTHPSTLYGFHDAWTARNMSGVYHHFLDAIWMTHGIEPHARADYCLSSMSVWDSAGGPDSKTLKFEVMSKGAFKYDKILLRVRVTVNGSTPSQKVDIYAYNLNWSSWEKTKSISIKLEVPAVKIGSSKKCSVMVQLDPHGLIPESNESNNHLKTTWTVPAN